MPQECRLPCLTFKHFNAFSKETYEKLVSQGSSVGWVTHDQLARPPSVHENRPLHDSLGKLIIAHVQSQNTRNHFAFIKRMHDLKEFWKKHGSSNFYLILDRCTFVGHFKQKVISTAKIVWI